MRRRYMERDAPTLADLRARQKEEVSVTLRRVTEKAIAVVDGTMEDGREKLFWLPRSVLAGINGVDVWHHVYLDALIGETITVLAPQWILKDRGLL